MIFLRIKINLPNFTFLLVPISFGERHFPTNIWGMAFPKNIWGMAFPRIPPRLHHCWLHYNHDDKCIKNSTNWHVLVSRELYVCLSGAECSPDFPTSQVPCTQVNSPPSLNYQYHRGRQHCPKITSLPLQMAEHLHRAQPDSVANHVTDRSISDRHALTWFATETGWARSKRSTICSGKLITGYMFWYEVNRKYNI